MSMRWPMFPTPLDIVADHVELVAEEIEPAFVFVCPYLPFLERYSSVPVVFVELGTDFGAEPDALACLGDCLPARSEEFQFCHVS